MENKRFWDGFTWGIVAVVVLAFVVGMTWLLAVRSMEDAAIARGHGYYEVIDHRPVFFWK